MTDTLAWDGAEQSAVPGVARGDELATVWQQWPKANDLDMLFCARDGPGTGQTRGAGGGGGGW